MNNNRYHIHHWGQSTASGHPNILKNACRPVNEYLYEPRHLSEFVWDIPIGLVTLPGTPKVVSSSPTCSQTYSNISPCTAVPVIRYSSYSEGRPECPPRVWYSLESDISQFTFHILSDTAGVCLGLKYMVVMCTQWMQCSVNAVLGECCTWLMLYSVNAVLSVNCWS